MLCVSWIKVMHETYNIVYSKLIPNKTKVIRHNDVFIFGKCQSVLAKTCKKNSLCSSRLLASTVIFNKL